MSSRLSAAELELIVHCTLARSLTLFKDLFPLIILACGLIFLFWKPEPPVDPNAPVPEPKEPRVVLRPGSRASVEYNKSLQRESKLNTLGPAEKNSIAVSPSSDLSCLGYPSLTSPLPHAMLERQESTSMMSAPAASLPEPLDTPISISKLAEHTGTDSSKPIYVAIKGTVFDVTAKREMYGPGGSYSVFAGKDGSRGLGMSSLKPEDAVSDYSGLDDKQTKVRSSPIDL